MDNDKSNVEKDMTYSPASETETEELQGATVPSAVDADIDYEQVKVLPGTGGPDDGGEIELDQG